MPDCRHNLKSAIRIVGVGLSVVGNGCATFWGFPFTTAYSHWLTPPAGFPPTRWTWTGRMSMCRPGLRTNTKPEYHIHVHTLALLIPNQDLRLVIRPVGVTRSRSGRD